MMVEGDDWIGGLYAAFFAASDAIGRAECKDILWRLLLSSVRPCQRPSQSVRSLPVYCRNSPPVGTVCGPRSCSSWKQTPPWSMKWYLLDAMLAQVRRKPLVEAWLAPRVISELDRRLDSLATYFDQPRVRQAWPLCYTATFMLPPNRILIFRALAYHIGAGQTLPVQPAPHAPTAGTAARTAGNPEPGFAAAAWCRSRAARAAAHGAATARYARSGSLAVRAALVSG
jgi:hypothetical protein